MSFPVPTRIRRTALAVVAAALAVPAVASAACPTATTSQLFKQWGDTAQYSLLSGGTFESGTTGWNLSNASVATGNEPWKVAGSTHAKSLSVKAGGSATSPAFCVSFDHPTFRFFAKKNSSVSWGGVTYKAKWRDASGVQKIVTLGYLEANGFGSWAPTPVLPLGTSLPLWQNGDSLNVQLVFEVAAGGADLLIDDVAIDPYVRG